MNLWNKRELQILCRLATARGTREDFDDARVEFYSKGRSTYAAIQRKRLSLKIRALSGRQIAPVTIDADELLHALRSHREPEVAITFSASQVGVGGNYHLKPAPLRLEAVGDGEKGVVIWRTDHRMLKQLARVAPFHGTERFKPHLMSWLIRLNERGLLACAGDGICYAAYGIDEPQMKVPDLLLPPEILVALPILEGALQFERPTIGAWAANIVRSARVELRMMVDSHLQYPNARKLLDQARPVHVVVPRKEFLQASQLVLGAFSNPKYVAPPTTRLAFDFKKSTLTMCPIDSAMETKQTVPMEVTKAPSGMKRLTRTGHVAPFPDALEFCATDKVTLEVEPADKPLAIHAVNDASNAHATVLIAGRRMGPAAHVRNCASLRSAPQSLSR